MLRKSKFKSFIWYSSVGLLVTLAVAVSIFRVYFSSVEEYRDQLAAMAGRYLGQPVTISGMDARVVGLSPTVILTDVALLHKDGKQLLTRFESIDIALDPIASLRNLAPIVELTVSGANLEISRNLDGTFGVQGLELAQKGKVKPPIPVEPQQNTEEPGRILGSWFLSQSRLGLRNSNITLYDKKSDDRFSFSRVELELRNSGEHHRLNGFIHLPKRIGRELSVAVDIEGDLLQAHNWSGDFYLKTVQLRPREWMQQYSWEGSSIREGLLDLEVWSRWEEGEIETVTTRLNAAGVLLSRDKHQQLFSQLGLDAQLSRQEAGWQLDIRDLKLQHNDAAPMPMRLVLSYQDETQSLLADQLDLKALSTLLPFLPMLDEKQRSMIREISPSGVAEKLYVQRLADKRIVAQGEVSELKFHAWEKLPGISGINVNFNLGSSGGVLKLGSDDGSLSLPRLFRAPLKLGNMSSEFVIRQEPDAWQLTGKNILLSNSDVSAQLDMDLLLEKGSKPWLSLQGRFSGRDALAVPQYLPVGKLKEKSLYWLDNAFKAGTVPSGSLQFHGSTGDFPFREHQGRFEVLFDAKDVQLHYRDGWPDFHQLSGEVHFDGPGLWISADGARVFDAQLGATSVSIENLRAARLLIDGRAVLPINDGLRFLRESPLSKNTGKVLDTMQGSGNAVLALQLAIPLSPKVAESMPLNVKGRLDFSNNHIDIIEGVSAQQLSGSLHFTQKHFTADELQAKIFGKPASIVVTTDGDEKPIVVVAARGQVEIPVLQQAFKLQLLEYLQGKTDWQASLQIPRGVSSEGTTLYINSSLRGVSSSLPSPLQKDKESERDMGLSFHLSGIRAGETELTLKDEFGVVWRQEVSQQERRLSRVQLRLGAASPLSLPQRDVIEVFGRGGRIQLAPWLNVLRKLKEESKGSGDKQPPLPIIVSMEQLHMLSGADGSSGTTGKTASIKDFPKLDFAVDELNYDDLPLGKVSLKLLPQGQRLSVKEIKLESELYSLSGDGEWNSGGNTFFNYEMNSPKLGVLLKRFGFVSVIEGGKTSASGKMWWAGAPTEVSLAGLNGEMALSVKDGTIIDVEPGAGRMLGILSLPALPRRLFLDFSDVFKQGFSFDRIKGDIRVEQGQAYTTNLQLESIPASILITGRTGLDTEDFDQEMFVVPNVRDTATVASALAWGPQVAAVVALFQEVFKEDISAATMTRYRITGSWDEPHIRRAAEQQEEEEDLLFLE